MILIFDDTFEIRYKFNDVSYLQLDIYKEKCTIYEKPTIEDFRRISSTPSLFKLLFTHRSLRLFDKDGNIVNGAEVIENFKKTMQSNNITKIDFGRDTVTNYTAKTLEKNFFYTNLKPFLDNYIENSVIELKILFYGENYLEIEKLTFIDKVISRIDEIDIEMFYKDTIILEGIQLIFSESSVSEVINDWIKKGLNKKEIRQIINNKI
jgi:hypothetical protein